MVTDTVTGMTTDIRSMAGEMVGATALSCLEDEHLPVEAITLAILMAASTLDLHTAAKALGVN